MGDHYDTREQAVEALHRQLARLGFDHARIDLTALESEVLRTDVRRPARTPGWTFDPTRGEPLRRVADRHRHRR
ncbi:hypothetical protein [Agrococcus jejuensis]|uniref:hypothetical protein n=1 Tax=Agrococcus jejuensis TaxID=399736 RepID=UPI0011A706F3|nr:hypothetical protein [Agrococcus jejuensis]